MADLLEKVGYTAKRNITYKGTENAKKVLAKRTYLNRDEHGNLTETPEDMFWRVASTLAKEEAKYGASEQDVAMGALSFYELMVTGRFLPNSPTLMNAGRPLGQLSACYVLPVEDSLSNGKDGIYDSLRNMALIHQSGGGTGFSFSRIRGTGSHVRSSAGVASGPVSFMSLFDFSTEVVKQGGTRRGANMGILRVDHPDILEFISCKKDLSKNQNFNISIAVTDAFMRAVEDDDYYKLYDHRDVFAGELKARKVFDLLVENAWATGEPGLYFIDEANKHNPVPHLGSYEATNPCGEQPLLPFDVCNLGSINVGAYVVGDTFDWLGFQVDVHKAVRLLDNVIDANKYPLPEVHDLAHRIRRIGLGIMGFADALIRLGIPYNSPEGVAFGKEVMKRLKQYSHDASEVLSQERGVFPEWEKSMWGPEGHNRPMRHCNVTTIAPTGTISLIAGCSSGIEPLFAVAFFRKQAGMDMVDYNEDLKKVLDRKVSYTIHTDKSSEEILEEAAVIGHVPEYVPQHIRRVFVTAHDVTPEQHVDMQAAFQTYCDSAISKTCNFPQHATQDDVRRVYVRGWKAGLKGITVYRDGSRDGQVLSTGATGQDNTGLEVVAGPEQKCDECGSTNVVVEGGRCVKCLDCDVASCKIA